MTQVLPEGKLNFSEGYPTQKSNERLYDSAYDLDDTPLVETRFEQASGPTTSEVIILGTDTETPQKPEKKTYEQILKAAADGEYIVFNGWIEKKVQNELVDQIYTIYKTTGRRDSQISISAVSDVIRRELASEKMRRFEEAAKLEKFTIPDAKKFEEPSELKKNPYWIEDVSNLSTRIDVNIDIAQRIESIQETGEEGLYDLSEVYIKLMFIPAYEDVLAIVKQQNEKIEAEYRESRARVSELEGAITVLSTQLEDRDMQLLDQDLDEYEPDTIAA